MLKWAVTPRLAGEFYERDGMLNYDAHEGITLENLLAQHNLPCLVRLINEDLNDPLDNYCLLLCETDEPYLVASNETDRFAIPLSFDGLFAPVDHGVTRYSILQSVRAVQTHLKTTNSSSQSSSFSHFTTLQPCMAYSNSALRRIRPGTILEPCRTPPVSAPSPSPSRSSIHSSSSASPSRLRSLLANIPHSINKHLLPHHQSSRSMKKQTPPNDYLEVKSLQNDEHFCLKSDSLGTFVPVQTRLPVNNSQRRSTFIPCSPSFSSSSSSFSLSNQSQGLFTVTLLSQLTDQYPLISELVISRTLEENVPTSVGYPLRRLTLHRFVEHHRRLIAFDMKNYTFLELDTTNPLDLYLVEPDETLFQRYQAQLRWCQSHLPAFRSQLKSITHSLAGVAMFVQATPLHGQQLQQYHQRRDSSSSITSPQAKHIPQTIFTSQESISSIRSRACTPSSISKFNTTSTRPKKDHEHLHKGKTTGSVMTSRKDVRVYFNDPSIQKRLQQTTNASPKSRPTIKQTSFHEKHFNYQSNSAESDSNEGDEELDESYQCTAL